MALHDEDADKTPDFLKGRQDGMTSAALIMDGYVQRLRSSGRISPDAIHHIQTISDSIKFGTQMLDLTDGRMPPPKDQGL